jgi:hypothetical protein
MGYKEKWKDVIGFEGLYKVSNLGNVISLITKKPLKANGDNYGYLQVILYKGNKRITGKVHRLVAKAFIDNTENKPQVNHKDGNKKNNNISNLEWMTNKENKRHAIDNGITKMHINTRIGKLKSKGTVILNIDNGIYYKSPTEASKDYNVNAGTVRRWIQKGMKNLIRC